MGHGGPEKPHRQYRELSNITKWPVLMGGMKWGGGIESRGRPLSKLLENINRRNRNDGGGKLIPIFGGPNPKIRSSPPAMALTFEYPVSAPS